MLGGRTKTLHRHTHTHTHTPMPILCLFFFNSLLFRDASTFGRIASRIIGCIPEVCVFLLLCNRFFFVKFTDLILWFLLGLWLIMVKWIMVMKIQPRICLDDWRKSPKNSQIVRHRNLNPRPSEYESSVLALRHLSL